MRRLVILRGGLAAAIAVCLAAAPALAQQSYPTGAAGVRVPGTVPLQCNAALTSCTPATTSNPTPMQGDVASGSADSGNPVKVGGVYNATPPTFADGQRAVLGIGGRGALKVELWANNSGTALGFQPPADAMASQTAIATFAQSLLYNGATWDRQRGDVNGTVVQPALSSAYWNYAAAASGIVNTTTAVTIKAAAGAGVRNYLCTLNVGHDALGAASELAVRDGAAGTVLFRMKLQTAASEGASEINFTPCLKGTANTLLEVVTLTATVSGGTYVNASGFTGQ